MPARSINRFCKCGECISSTPNGRLFSTDIAYRAHLAASLVRQGNGHLFSDSPRYHPPIASSSHDISDIVIIQSPPNSTATRSMPAASRHPLAHARADSVPPIDGGVTLSRSEATTDRSSGHRLGLDIPRPQQKREFNRHALKSLEILSTIDKRLDDCSEVLKNDQRLWDRPNISATFRELRQALERIKNQAVGISTTKDTITSKLNRLEEQFSRSDQFVESFKDIEYDMESWFVFGLENHSIFAETCFIIIAVSHIVLNLSRRSSEIIIGLLRILLGIFCSPNDSILSSLIGSSLLSRIPKTLAPIMSAFNFDGRTIVHAVCPRCHYLYEPKLNLGSSKPIYPERCIHIVSSEEGICNEPLLGPSSPANSNVSPLKTFVYNDFDDYVASLLSRKELEARIDRICDETLHSVDDPPTFQRSIFDGNFIRNFEGPDSSRERRILFIDRGNEARLLFSINMDFFHPDGMRVRGATESCGIISMACLSLGLDICFLPENMYISGIIPGPQEPSGSQCNHYFKPLISALSRSWERGVYYSRMANHPRGRRARSAVVLSVNDLPAARKYAGHAAHNSHHYCSHCQGYGKESLINMDISTLRDSESMRKSAHEWLGEQSSRKRGNLFESTGVRWSELWRLPYWNPVRQLAIDPMHCIFEGIIQRHVREILGLTVLKAREKPDSEDAFVYHFSIPDFDCDEKVITQVKQIHQLLLAPLYDPTKVNPSADALSKLEKRLMAKNKPALKFVCADLGSQVADSKPSCVSALINWRKQFPMSNERLFIKVTTAGTMQFIQNVIKSTITPSWVHAVPSNFGTAAAGTLKAEEWRNLSFIYLPIALIALWGPGSTHPSPAVERRALGILNHTMLLFNAARIISLRNINEERILLHESLIASYVQQLKTLYAKAPIVVNHHMALHIAPFFRDFGPARSWWCFPFERLIGILQREHTNARHGSRESTMLQTFIRKSRLRSWLARFQSKPVIAACGNLLDDLTTWRRDDEDSVVEDNPRVVPLPDDLCHLTKIREGTVRARFKKGGTIFSRASTHLGNSLVLFHPSGNFQTTTVPGRIEYIFTVKGVTHFALYRHLNVVNKAVDPYATFYPRFPARVFSSMLSSNLEVVEPNWIVGHFARWNLSSDLVVVLDLSRE